MPKLNVNPTRMALTKLKGQLVTSKRGHKLLKDKQDELMRQFITLIRQNNTSRREVEQEMQATMADFVLANATLPNQFIEALFALPVEQVSVIVQEKNIMSVKVPQMNFRYDAALYQAPLEYGYLNTNADLDRALARLTRLLPKLLALAEVEKTCQLMAAEIEKTRRRVNALEYMTIPQQEETIYSIQMKLEENERASITRLIKVKNMNEAKRVGKTKVE